LVVKRILKVLVVAGLASAQSPGGEMAKVNEAAPKFKLAGSDGKTYTLDQFKGKKAVVLAWFPKAFTGG
jgi:peroxiredoxin Q/BCP